MFGSQFLAVLVSAILLKNSHQHLLSFPDFPEERISPTLCSAATNGQTSCLNCGEAQLCLLNGGLPAPYVTTCSGSSPVCGVDSSSPPKYTCVASNVNCECPGTPGLSYKPDPFNSHYYTVCSGTVRTIVNCDSTYYNPQKNDCSGTTPSPPPPGVCPGPGAFEDSDTTTCDGYILCSSSLAIISSGKCAPPTNYFSPETHACANPIPPFSCQPSYIGKYGDPFDCKRYYVCSGTTLLGVECCPPAQQFDVNLSDCSTTATCTALPLCARAAATTTTSTSTPSTTTSTTTSTSTPSTTTSTTTPSTTTSTSTPSTTTSTTTTTLSSGCTSLANFRCPAPDGYYAQCNYCARTYFQCVSGTATLRTCSGNLLFNTVPSYPACLTNCPYYP